MAIRRSFTLVSSGSHAGLALTPGACPCYSGIRECLWRLSEELSGRRLLMRQHQATREQRRL